MPVNVPSNVSIENIDALRTLHGDDKVREWKEGKSMK